MSTQPDQRHESATSRHQAAVAMTLESAERAGQIGDYADALQWVRVIEAIGERLPDAFEAKRRLWMDKLAGAHPPDRSTGRPS